MPLCQSTLEPNFLIIYFFILQVNINGPCTLLLESGLNPIKTLGAHLGA